MGAPNFGRVNANKIFAVLMSREETFFECDNCNEKQYSYEYNKESFENITTCSACDDTNITLKTEWVGSESYEYEDLIGNIQEIILEKKTPFKDLWYRDSDESINDRSYGGRYIFELSVSKSFGDVEVEVVIKGNITSGYHEGAVLDWEMEYNDSDILDLKYDFQSSDMSVGLQVIQRRHAEKWCEKQKERLVSMVEEVYESLSQPLKCVAVFSNGEAIYESN